MVTEAGCTINHAQSEQLEQAAFNQPIGEAITIVQPM
jgi:hypothetical protein